jgi:hypothetical protein
MPWEARLTIGVSIDVLGWVEEGAFIDDGIAFIYDLFACLDIWIMANRPNPLPSEFP